MENFQISFSIGKLGKLLGTTRRQAVETSKEVLVLKIIGFMLALVCGHEQKASTGWGSSYGRR